MADINLSAAEVAQLILSIGNAAALSTKDKTSLVAAINEPLATAEQALVVRFTKQSSGTITADKTIAEIYAAHSSGKPVTGVYASSDYQLMSAETGGLYFASWTGVETFVLKGTAGADADSWTLTDMPIKGGNVQLKGQIDGEDFTTVAGAIRILNERKPTFVVTVTGSGSSAAADKTYAEIADAYSAGKECCCLCGTSEGSGSNVIPLISCAGGIARFFGLISPNIGWSIGIRSNGSITAIQTTLDANDVNYTATIDGTAVQKVDAALNALNARKDVAVFSATLSGETLNSAATFPQISAAYSAGKQVLLKVLASGGIYWLLPLVQFLDGMVASFAAWVSNSRLAVATLNYSAASTPPVNEWLLTQVPLSAESVAYSGEVGDAGSSPNTVSNVANALVALTVGEPLNVTANFVDSGAASVAEWAVAGSGDYYNIGEGYYIIATTDTRYYVRILGRASMTQRIVQIWKQGRVNIEPTVEIWQCTAPGATPEMLLRYETYRGDLTIPNRRWDWQVPDYRGRPDGSVLAMRNGQPVWMPISELTT